MNPVHRCGEPGYEQARRATVWNARKPDHRPELIVTARSEEDVVSTIRFARARGLKVAVRSGGHSWFGASLLDEGLLLDLSQLGGFDIDGDALTATVRPALEDSQLAAALAAQELAFPVGHCASVALGGYLLAGGLRWNFGSWGSACFSVEAVDTVGEVVRPRRSLPAELAAPPAGGPPPCVEPHSTRARNRRVRSSFGAEKNSSGGASSMI